MRDQASMRRGMGVLTELTPMSLTPRRMKGATVVGRSMPCARPQAATVPSGFICEITLASVTDPTESMQPAQRDLASGFTGVLNSLRSTTPAAPRLLRKGSSDTRPVEAITL